ncbi:hypothetical protein HZA85_00660 [Candidatus Uhrbacteria bacterium]|nr:hypothetical protein [Candidatus Uhrbacteria bacterium]
MVLAAIATGAARGAAVAGRAVVSVGRAAVGAGRAAGRGGARAGRAVGRAGSRAGRAVSQTTQKAARKTGDMRSELQRARLQGQQFQLRSNNSAQLQQRAFRNGQDKTNTKDPRQKNDKQRKEEEHEKEEEQENDEQEEEEEDPIDQMKRLTGQLALSQQASAATKFKAATSALRQFHAMQAATPEEAKPSQDIAKAAAKKVIPKAALFIANSIAGALELGTGGVAFLVTFVIRFITLGWYNIEMVYGGWVTKGKHKIIGPLTWDPIPMPFPKNDGTNAIGPMIVLLATDLIMILVSMLPFILIAIVIAAISA